MRRTRRALRGVNGLPWASVNLRGVRTGYPGGCMKIVSLTAAAALLAFGLVITGVAQGPQPAPNITTLAGDVHADWSAQKETFINAADAMPADKFGYKSTPAQR